MTSIFIAIGHFFLVLLGICLTAIAVSCLHYFLSWFSGNEETQLKLRMLKIDFENLTTRVNSLEKKPDEQNSGY